MTSLRSAISRGAPLGLGVFTLVGMFGFATLASAADPANPAAAPATTTTTTTTTTAAPPATGAPPATSTGSTPAATGGGAADSGAYTVRLRSLEKNVNELKGADLPHQGAPQSAQGDGPRRRHRRLARHHPPQERDGQLVPPDQGGLRARRRADLFEGRRHRPPGRDDRVRRLQRRHPARLAHADRRSCCIRATASACSATSRDTSSRFKSSHTFVAGESKTTGDHRRRLREGEHYDQPSGQSGRRFPGQRDGGRRGRDGGGAVEK